MEAVQTGATTVTHAEFVSKLQEIVSSTSSKKRERLLHKLCTDPEAECHLIDAVERADQLEQWGLTM